MDGGGKKGGNPHKVSTDHRSDRKSATGMSGEPKKGGRGGKFTWEGADEDLHLISPKNGAGNNARAAKAGGGGVAKKGGEDDE